MQRQTFRIFLVVALVTASGFAAWSWFRPYAWGMDPAARCKVMGVQVRNDQSYYWVDVRLKMLAGQTHDLLKPVRLRTAAGREVEPADTTMAGDKNIGTTDLWFKFWLENKEMTGPLSLRINDGTLAIKADAGIPSLGPANSKYFPTQHW